MESIHDANDVEVQDAEDRVKEKAIESGRKILKIVWDEADGYPEHGWGHVQYSVRPYRLGDGCDGTTDLNIHYIARAFCLQLGLSYIDLYDEAYGDRSSDWLEQDFTEIEKETDLPELTTQNLCGILADLEQINNHSLVTHLTEVFQDMGLDVGEWWEEKDRQPIPRDLLKPEHDENEDGLDFVARLSEEEFEARLTPPPGFVVCHNCGGTTDGSAFCCANPAFP